MQRRDWNRRGPTKRKLTVKTIHHIHPVADRLAREYHAAGATGPHTVALRAQIDTAAELRLLDQKRLWLQIWNDLRRRRVPAEDLQLYLVHNGKIYSYMNARDFYIS